MHTTNAGGKRKALKREVRGLARDAKAAKKAAKTLSEAGQKARELEVQADKLKAEADALKGAARLEDLNIWVMKKTKITKKGNQSYGYWMATWREGGKTRNIHLGSCAKMDAETARQKARMIKAEALGIPWH